MGEVIVLDSSAVLAAIFAERGGEKVRALKSRWLISTVNLEEVRTRLIDYGHSAEDIERYLELFNFDVVDFTKAQAVASSNLRATTRKSGLSLGDRACLALAMERDAVAMTTDQQWAKVDVPAKVELLRTAEQN
jgi:ribonuclease VapC